MCTFLERKQKIMRKKVAMISLWLVSLKINLNKNDFKINKVVVLKYFDNFNESNDDKYRLFKDYFTKFYHFCFELSTKTVIKDALKFKD